MRLTRTILVAIFCLSATAMAQPMADRVPDNAIFYVGWCGTDSMPSGYEGSHLKGVLDASNIPAMVNEVVPRLISRAIIENPRDAAPLQLLNGIIPPLLKHPTAFYFSGIDLNARGRPPKMGVICKAGNDAAALAEKFNQLQQISGNNPPITVTTDGDTVTMQMGMAQPAAGGKLSDAATFKAALANVQSQPALVLYGDGEKFFALINEMLQRQSPRELAKWNTIRDASGINGVKRLIITAGFDGKDWSQQAFLEAPAPRNGLLGLLNSAPLSDDLLKAVPMSATYFAAASFDLSDFLVRLRTLVGQADPRGLPDFDRGLGMVSAMIGKNVQTDVLDPLGPQWAIYVDPYTAGQGIAGLVIVNKLDDPAKAEAGLNAVALFLSNAASGAMKRDRMELLFRQTKVAGVNVNYMAMPFITPAWAVNGGNLYIALYPQVVGAAASRGNVSGGKVGSILDNPDFLAMRKRLGTEGKNITGMQYVDLPKTAVEGYQTALMLSRIALGFADLFGAKTPDPVLPMLRDLLPHLSPAGSVSWVDDAGLHMKSVSPFPGSQVIGGGQSLAGPLIGTQAVGMAILLPSLNRAETANRVKCASNMKQMGQAILMWANEHNGKYPDKLSDLLTEEIAVDVFLCPSQGKSVPLDVANAGAKAWAAWVDANADYIYLGAGMNNKAGAETIVIYEKPGNHDNDGMNILFGDGHVEFNRMMQAMQRIEQQQAANPNPGGAK